MGERRPGAIRSEAARIAILRATADLLTHRGYEHLTMEGIAAEARVGKQTIYRWWPSKSALVADSMLDGFLMPGGTNPRDTGDVRRDLADWLRDLFLFVEAPENEMLMRSLVSAATDNREIGRRLHDRLGANSALTMRLREAVDTGDVRDDLPAQDVGELFVGAIVLRILTREPTDVDLAVRLVRAVLGPPPTPTRASPANA